MLAASPPESETSLDGPRRSTRKLSVGSESPRGGQKRWREALVPAVAAVSGLPHSLAISEYGWERPETIAA
jgi:hypothetical protein